MGLQLILQPQEAGAGQRGGRSWLGLMACVADHISGEVVAFPFEYPALAVSNWEETPGQASRTFPMNATVLEIMPDALQQ